MNTIPVINEIVRLAAPMNEARHRHYLESLPGTELAALHARLSAEALQPPTHAKGRPVATARMARAGLISAFCFQLFSIFRP